MRPMSAPHAPKSTRRHAARVAAGALGRHGAHRALSCNQATSKPRPNAPATRPKGGSIVVRAPWRWLIPELLGTTMIIINKIAGNRFVGRRSTSSSGKRPPPRSSNEQKPSEDRSSEGRSCARKRGRGQQRYASGAMRVARRRTSAGLCDTMTRPIARLSAISSTSRQSAAWVTASSMAVISSQTR